MITESSIYNLLINNHQFDFLKQQLNQFNPFKILKISDHEIRHSNVFAWLLDPKGNHNLHSTIFKKVILEIIMNPENEQRVPSNFSIQDIYKSDFSDVKVFREKQNIDIFLISELNKVIVYFENKIKSNQTREQLDRYYKSVTKEFEPKKYKILPVLLTLSNEDPLHPNYSKYGYEYLYDLITSTLDLNKSKIPDEVLEFINYYLQSLKDLLMNDENIEKICREIYNDNKEVIDLIYNVGNNIDLSNAIDGFKKLHKEIKETFKSNRTFWFIVDEFQIKTKIGTENWNYGYPFAFWFEIYSSEKLKLVLEVGPFKNQDLRDKFISHLEKFDISVNSRAKEPGRLYTRLCTDTITIKDWSNNDEVTLGMSNLFIKKKMQNTREKLAKAIDAFNWS